MKKIITSIFNYIKNIWLRFFKFGMVGVSGTIVELIIVIGLNLIFARVAADFWPRNIIQFTGYEISVFTNFLLSYFWVWKDRQGKFLFNFFKYNLSTAIAFAVRISLFNIGMFIFNPPGSENMVIYYLNYVFANGMAMFVNFLMINHKVFIRKAVHGKKNKYNIANL